MHSQLLEGLKRESQTENNKRAKSWGPLLGSQHYKGVEGRARVPGWTKKKWQASITHKTHHGPDLGEATTFPFIVYSATLQGGHIQMAFLSRDSLDFGGA
jgi:hypothetical protein